MRRFKLFLLLSFLLILVSSFTYSSSSKPDNYSNVLTRPLPLNNVEVIDPFWSKRQELVRTVTIPSQLEIFKRIGGIDNFQVAAGEKGGTHRGFFYADSDLYKWLEAASYSLGAHPDPELEAEVDEVIRSIAAAQQPDGYLNTYYQIFFPDRRWTNLLIHHELYCAGHLIEAACAHHEATGKTALLDVAVKLADHIAGEFGPGKNEGIPGHEEIELALIRLYRVTGKQDYLDLASFFIHQRGKKKTTSELLENLRDDRKKAKIVKEKREPFIPGDDKSSLDYSVVVAPQNPIVIGRVLGNYYSGKYFQAHEPFVDQDGGVGHSVRAMYLYSGAADLYAETGEQGIFEALEKIWWNVADRKMYITGGAGSLPLIEGFGKDYELPNRSYTESCAAIGMAFWNWRMLQITGESVYAEIFELALYNGILSGLSLDGKKYFYRNPLVSHGRDERKEWYSTACCPPNLARMIAGLGRYIYGTSDDGIWVYQYIGSKARFDIKGRRVEIIQESGFPWEGNVEFTVKTEKPVRFSLYFRIPQLCVSTEVSINGMPQEIEHSPGTFQKIEREWKNRDKVEIRLETVSELISSPLEVRANRGRVAVVRWPIVYCIEDKDNPGMDIHKARIAIDPQMNTEHTEEMGGMNLIKGKLEGGMEFTAIPYYAWANRGPSDMQVWSLAE